MKVSIVIPVYNVEKYLRRCLDSVFRQTYSDFEVVCINDGSTDSSLAILDEYRRMYDNLAVYTIPNGGQANARNLGVKKSQGEFICFLDSDDYIENTMLEVLVRTQQQDKCDMVICGIDRIFEDGVSKIEKLFKYDADLDEKHTVSIYEYPKIITVVKNSPFSKLIRKDVILKHNVEFPVGYIYEDFTFTHTLIATGLTISIIQDKLYKYIVRKGSTMTSKQSRIKDMFPMYEQVVNTYKEFGIYERFKKELDFLGFYHIGIGTSYRLFRSKQQGLFSSLKLCRNYLRDAGCMKENKYIKERSLFERLFISIYM